MEQFDVAPIGASRWLAVMEREYLQSWIPAGGAAAKFVVAEPTTHDRLRDALSDQAREAEMEAARVDASETACHLPQEIFFAISRALPWPALVQRHIERIFAAFEYPWPRPGQPMGLAELAQHFAIAPQLLDRHITEWLSWEIWKDAALAQDFRAALSALCRDRLTTSMPGVGEVSQVQVWLTGGKAALGGLRAQGIGRRIDRSNARVMLISLCHWLRKLGSGGLFLTLDLRPALRHRSEAVGSRRYSPLMIADLYEVLREILDDQERLPGLFLFVQADEALLSDDPRRSLRAYTALEMRLWPDVHPEGRQSPLAPLVKVGEAS